MPKCVLGALVLSIVLPSIAPAQSPKPAGAETIRLAEDVDKPSAGDLLQLHVLEEIQILVDGLP